MELKQIIRNILCNFYYDAIENGYKNVHEKHTQIVLEQFYSFLDARLKKIEENHGL